MALHISIVAEPLFYIGPVPVTNSMFTSFIVSALIIIVALRFSRSVKNFNHPKGIQNVLETIVEMFYNLCNSITQNELKTAVILPIPLAAFMWILLNNWFGLLPGVGTIGLSKTVDEIESHQSYNAPARNVAFASEPESQETAQTESSEHSNVSVSKEGEEVTVSVEKKFFPLFRPGTADLNTTIALALISVGATQAVGIKYLGRSYWSKFFNLKGISSFVGILEFIGEFTKIISYAFRLFGNIFAGEVLIVVMTFLVPLIVPVPFISIEIFVGIIQAFVFAILTIVFMNMATVHDTGEH